MLENFIHCTYRSEKMLPGLVIVMGCSTASATSGVLGPYTKRASTASALPAFVKYYS
jgi:hypothetical protein